jgi:hypothetical protein
VEQICGCQTTLSLRFVTYGVHDMNTRILECFALPADCGLDTIREYSIEFELGSIRELVHM